MKEYEQPEPPAEVPEPLEIGDELERHVAEYERTLSNGRSPEDAAKVLASDNLLNAYGRTRETLAQYAAVVEQEKALIDFKAAVAKIRDDVPAAAGVNDDLLVGFLMLQYQVDPHTAEAWDNRLQEPGPWKERLERLGRQFGKQFRQMPDVEATASREAVANAVRGASRRGDSNGAEMPPLGDLSNADYAKVVAQWGITNSKLF